MMAAIPHDMVEDTGRSLEELEARFGPTVDGCVREVTNDKSLPKEEYQRLQIVKAAGALDDAKRIKLHNKLPNLAAPLVGRSKPSGVTGLGAGSGGEPARRRYCAGGGFDEAAVRAERALRG
jgi:hypothetical protein